MLKDLQSQTYYRDPYPVIEKMRNEGALVQTRIPILGKVWLTTTQSAAAQILKDSDRFTVRKTNGGLAGLSWWMPRSIQRLAANMLSFDDPEHARLRGIVDHAFQRRVILDLEKRVKILAQEQFSVLEKAGDGADLIKYFARAFPLSVICELLGLPQEDRAKFMEWASSITTVRGVFSFLLAIRRLKPLTKYIENRVSHERKLGGSGLIHELVHETDEKLSDDELVSMIFLLLMAGHETTTHLISGGVFALLEDQEQLEILRENTELKDMAVEELLRFVSPVQTTKPRYVREDCVIDGIRLSEGDLVMPFLAAANCDPAVFENPEKLDISRRPNRHMEFGSGPHFCLGNQLARMEAKIAVELLLLSDQPVQLAVDKSEIRWIERFGLRGLKALPVKLGPQHP